MRGTLLSINAIYNYDSTIFEDLELPAVSDLPDDPDLFISDPEPLDKDLLIGNILMELGELSLVYSDPGTLKKMIRIWSAIHKREWLDLWKTLLYSYNPIWNKDGSYTDTKSGNTGLNSSTSTAYGRTLEHGVTGYDTNAYSPDTRDTAGGTDTVTTGATGTSSETLTHTEQGNIGVTTTQQMIKEQREIVQFNLYQYITESFKTQFCVMIY